MTPGTNDKQAAPYPWDDITPIGPMAADEDDQDDMLPADLALVVLVVTLVIFVVGAGTGYLYARL